MKPKELRDLQERHAAACRRLDECRAKLTPEHWESLTAKQKTAASRELAEAQVAAAGLHKQVTDQS